MTILELFIVAIGLSMDAFAVSVCKGLAMDDSSYKRAAIVGLWFGGFQAMMPLLGFFLGSKFESSICAYDHWVAFVLLALIGINMIREALKKGDNCDVNSGSLEFKVMFPMAVATSIDALAVGITFGVLKVNIIPAVSFIGIITFTLSVIGVRAGCIFGMKYKSKAELAGGTILVLLGLKILLEHLGILT
ncbi:MAG: manganese efflux pump MntP family protein [Acetivibrionales bacterium]|jgi:putative Mn2+ efflux pump MntP|nr:manganese efflux pump [Clostridiaceae bacterium]